MVDVFQNSPDISALAGILQESVPSERPQTVETVVLFDSTLNNVGIPDYRTLAVEASFKRRSRDALDPTKAGFYIREDATDFPIGFKEPEPFVIEGAEEWKKYETRRNDIIKRQEQKLALLGGYF